MYSDRKTKAEFIASRFSNYLKPQSVLLDVGCLEGLLIPFVENCTYYGLDILAHALKEGYQSLYENNVKGILLQVDLERGSIPFKDNSFDVVFCNDVLEHIDNLHQVFNEIIRVTRKYVIISLPNMFIAYNRKRMLLGKDNWNMYGLPVQKPIDRHKWFFSYNEAKRFCHSITKAKIVEEFPVYDTKPRVLRVYKRIFQRYNLFPNLFASTYWCVMEKA